MRGFPLISIDYMFLTPKGVIIKNETDSRWNDPPEGSVRIIAGICSATKVLIGVAVPQKGADGDGFAAKMLSEIISWLGHSKTAIRSDNEPAMLQLVAATTNLLRMSI